jgi:predicted regulator of Ras-like GTPase activity (Roadblock/LC7/MglB family)
VSRQGLTDVANSGLVPIAAEALRDVDQSAFTPILRRVLRLGPEVLGVAFVDSEGECVDYCSAIDPYDTKVAGAHLQMVCAELAPHLSKLGFGAPRQLHLVGEARELIVARVGTEYALVVIVRAGAAELPVQEGVARAVRELSQEAGLAPPPTVGTEVASVSVALRSARGWAYAPAAYESGAGRVEVAAVLGRWIDGVSEPGTELVCFRVRTDSGQELTLAHDVAANRWAVR